MDEFRDAIARITIDGENGRGTGFLVAPDIVATALHVVADRKVEPPAFFAGTIHLEFRGGHKTAAEVIPNKWNQDADCVLLRCLEPGQLAAYPTIPLRETIAPGELDQSDDLFKTRGYPDAQPVDGMTWAGKVRDYGAQLTNFYAQRRSAYQPVLQLFCEEAGAGSGAPPKGLSGAPIIVGTAAIGLMRFALMQDGRAVAGTLYGCSARDIVALDPERLSLRPPLAPTVLLTPEQMAQLAGLLATAFADNLNGLRRIVRFSLGAQVERSATPAKDVDEFIATLLPALAQQGPGMISVLLRSAITARPENQDLRAFAQQVSPQVSPYSLQPLSDDRDVQEAHDRELESKIERALIDLNRIRQARDLHHIMASYRPDFEKTRQQIVVLAKYKELHNCLHELQKRLNQIDNNVGRLKSGDNVGLYLKDDANFLRNLARKARNQTVNLPTAEDEQGWINELDACAEDMKAASLAVSVIDEKVLLVPERLAHLLPKASHINKELVGTAKDVGLNNFAETMRLVEQQLGAAMPENSLSRLREGTLSVGRLRARLAGLVSEHDEWQSLNTDLEYTKTQKKIQPQAKFSSWPQFKAKLIALCDAFPQEEWSIDLKTMMKPWMADEPPPEPQIPANIRKLEEDFQTFYKQCVDRFIEVDHELNELCKKIASFEIPLDALLSA
ncbi:effector-associated domain EAD1-containing protein [Bradyrhizobium sp. B117]|uniref:effector-associated domain EAD1-containing protein n=1 Tax=Bradyrhizobium sp. B117 TaxID=3140246 RepID=UPI003183D1A8